MQTVQAQIRLLLEQSDWDLHYMSATWKKSKFELVFKILGQLLLINWAVAHCHTGIVKFHTSLCISQSHQGFHIYTYKNGWSLLIREKKSFFKINRKNE